MGRFLQVQLLPPLLIWLLWLHLSGATWFGALCWLVLFIFLSAAHIGQAWSNTCGQLLQKSKETGTAAFTQSVGSAHVQIMDMASGIKTTSNPSTPATFSNDIATGCYLLLHRPIEDAVREGGDPHAEYFRDKKRNWEIRFQCCFHKPVKASSLKLGSAPYVRKEVGAAQLMAHRWLLNVAGPSLKGLYNSPGDDPRGRAPHDVEQPVTSIPICEVDQYHVTLPGEVCPNLLDQNFPQLGWLKSKDPVGHRKRIDECTFNVGETHTFAFWGPSRFFNLIRWQIEGVPMFDGCSVNMVNGPPPLYLTVYCLKPSVKQEKRHLESRIDVVWRVAGWSSQNPPTPEHQRRLQELVGGTTKVDIECCHSTPSTSGWFSRWAGKFVCCKFQLPKVLYGCLVHST